MLLFLHPAPRLTGGLLDTSWGKVRSGHDGTNLHHLPCGIVMLQCYIRENNHRALLGPERNETDNHFQRFMEDFTSYCDSVLSWQICWWIQPNSRPVWGVWLNNIWHLKLVWYKFAMANVKRIKKWQTRRSQHNSKWEPDQVDDLKVTVLCCKALLCTPGRNTVSVVAGFCSFVLNGKMKDGYKHNSVSLDKQQKWMFW